MGVKRITAEEASDRLSWLINNAAQEIEDVQPWIEGKTGYEGWIREDDYTGPSEKELHGHTFPIITKSQYEAMPEFGDFDVPDAKTIEKLREISRVASEVALYYEEHPHG